MAELSEGEAEVEGEELEGEYVGEHIRPAVPAVQEPPPESDSTKKKKGKRKKATPPIRINLSNCKYEVLRIVQRKLGWKEVGDDDDWEIYWTDTSVSIERIMKLTRIQKINHFSGMLEICRKRAMARNLMKMARQFPQHFDFFPRTFILPGDREEFMADIRSRGKKQVYILKPDAGCQGRGIRLVQGGKEEVVAKVLSEMATPNVVAQHYLSNPMLIHGYKFDLRIYALVLSCDPLRVFLFHEGLARICTEKYSPPKASNLDVSFMHLTNYAVNKKNEAFVAASAASADSGEDASKWCLAQLRQYINHLGHSYDKVWGDIADLIIKSLCSVQPILRNNYRSVLPPDNDGFSCFEILGYDIMLDDQLRPWLIEVNHSPSFNIDSPLDLSIKEELITQTIELVRVDPKLIAKTKKAEKRAATSRLLEPMHAKKAQAGRGAAGGAAASGQQQGQTGLADGKGDGEDGGGAAASGGAGAGAAAGAANFVKPRTPEEYEAWRAKVLAARERYEAKHMGNFTRIFPSPDPAKQALYEDLLKGAAEIYQASFQARSKRLDAVDEKKRREDAETESQRAERLKAKAHRDKLAQMAVERRKIKLLQQQAQQGQNGPPLLPAYLTPPPQPYLSPASSGTGPGGAVLPSGGSGSTPVYYVPMAPQGPYQYDPSVYQQYYIQQAYLYGTAAAGIGGAGVGQRLSEVYGERSDGATSAASSRPVSALSNCSGGAGGGMDNGAISSQPLQLVPQPPPPIRIYSGPLARAAAGGSAAGQRPGSSTATSGRSSPLSHHPVSAGGQSGAQLHQLQQQLLQTQLHQQQQQQQQSQTQTQQGALPPHPFLGNLRRPSSASSRAGTAPGEGGHEWGPAAAAGAAASPSSFTAGSGVSAFSRAAGGLGAGGGSHSFSYGHGGSGAAAAAFQQLPESHQGGGGPGGFPVQSQSIRPVSVGSAHNHVRHAHSGGALEATGVAYTGYSAYQDLIAGERDQSGGAGPGGPGGGGPARGLFINGSRPPSASAGPTSLRDKLQPGGAAAAAAAIGAAAAARKNSIAAAIAGSANSAAAAATWDAAMAAAAAAAGQDPAAFLQYFGAVRSRPESAGHRLRPTSAAGVQRSPSPLGSGMPAGGAGLGVGGVSGQAALSALGAGANGAVGGPISRTGSGGGRYGSADMYVLGLTQTLMQQAAQQAAPPALAIIATGAGSPKTLAGAAAAAAAAGGTTPTPSPRLQSSASGGPWDAAGAASPGQGAAGAMSAAAAGRVYKQSRATGVAAGYPILTPSRSASSSSGVQPAGGAGGGGGGISAAALGTTPSSPYYPQQQQQGLSGNGAASRSALEDEPPPPAYADDEDDGSPFTYQPLVMPDNGTAGSGTRHWSATGSTASGGAGSGSPPGPGLRQRSGTGGVAGVYVSPVAAPVVVTPSANGGIAAGAGSGAGALVGSPGSLASRPPVYPPPGGGPGIRPNGVSASGRVGSAAAGGAGAAATGAGSGNAVGAGSGNPAVSGKAPGTAGGVSTGGRLTSSGLAGGLAGSAPAPHAGLAVAGSMIARGVAAGSAAAMGPLQSGIEGLQLTGLDPEGQLRGAALAALNRKALTVKGRKVAQQ